LAQRLAKGDGSPVTPNGLISWSYQLVLSVGIIRWPTGPAPRPVFYTGFLACLLGWLKSGWDLPVL
jgi:hypothetical protein